MPEEVRLDKLLMQHGFASSRQRATELIKNGSVLVDSKVITKPGLKVSEEISLEVTQSEMSWVSRGALKLEAALDRWNIDPKDKVCLDVGASTGGFTELLLQRGASKVYAVDTGSDQLVERLRSDPRVVNLENTDIRNVNPSDFPQIDLIVIDVSFISLELIFPALKKFANHDQTIVSLVKPQFEVGREKVGKRGIVKNVAHRQEALEKIMRLIAETGWLWVDSIESPITGGDGNVEYLTFFKTKFP